MKKILFITCIQPHFLCHHWKLKFRVLANRKFLMNSFAQRDIYPWKLPSTATVTSQGEHLALSFRGDDGLKWRANWKSSNSTRWTVSHHIQRLSMKKFEWENDISKRKYRINFLPVRASLLVPSGNHHCPSSHLHLFEGSDWLSAAVFWSFSSKNARTKCSRWQGASSLSILLHVMDFLCSCWKLNHHLLFPVRRILDSLKRYFHISFVRKRKRNYLQYLFIWLNCSFYFSLYVLLLGI